MSFTRDEEKTNNPKALSELNDVISKAIKKVGGTKENDLCKYIPMTAGGYMHHFTLKKMKNKQPSQLSTLIKKFIIASSKPSIVAPKQRAARGSRKRKDHLTFTKTQLERLLNMARIAGDKEMITVLSPRKSLATCKRELIQAVRQGSTDQELWNAYVESLEAQETLARMAQESAIFQS